MFSERKVICTYLIIFAIIPFFNLKKNKDIIFPWIICSYCLFIFPFLSTKIEDSKIMM